MNGEIPLIADSTGNRLYRDVAELVEGETRQPGGRNWRYINIHCVLLEGDMARGGSQLFVQDRPRPSWLIKEDELKMRPLDWKQQISNRAQGLSCRKPIEGRALVVRQITDYVCDNAGTKFRDSF